MQKAFPKITPASDQSTLVAFGDRLGLDPHRDVLRFTTLMQRAADPFVRNVHPAHASVLVSFDARLVSHAQLETLLRERLRAMWMYISRRKVCAAKLRPTSKLGTRTRAQRKIHCMKLRARAATSSSRPRASAATHGRRHSGASAMDHL